MPIKNSFCGKGIIAAIMASELGAWQKSDYYPRTHDAMVEAANSRMRLSAAAFSSRDSCHWGSRYESICSSYGIRPPNAVPSGHTRPANNRPRIYAENENSHGKESIPMSSGDETKRLCECCAKTKGNLASVQCLCGKWVCDSWCRQACSECKLEACLLCAKCCIYCTLMSKPVVYYCPSCSGGRVERNVLGHYHCTPTCASRQSVI